MVAGALYTIGQIEDFGLARPGPEAQKQPKERGRGSTENYSSTINMRVRLLGDMTSFSGKTSRPN